ncbi:VPS10 domain-containing protein [Flavobacterium sp. RSB2_4_14]|uniref:WD40/YVTN/BNR-like repeat-containing protein n=1 Tax=Flavobacterium sp. RSB2_4_14 TaxID=3447665 RepID=UPI003F405A86
MKYIYLLFALFALFKSYNLVSQTSNITFQSIKIDTILNDKISIRALLIDKDKLWYASKNSRFGYYNFSTGEKFQKQIQNDSLKLEFRSIAQNSKFIFITNIGNPAFIFQIDKSDLSLKKVYTENHEKVFYDSMNFWNDQEGIVIGDPIENCISILITRDGGTTWNKISCDKLPKVMEGEAAFAASNTNIVIKKDKTWVVSGGKKSRVFYSPDNGKTWEVFETPIVQGKTMTGIFTADFYDKKIGVIAGGNYEVQEQNFQNKAMTIDGGKTWKLIGEKTGFGYASCIQFVPNSDGKQLVSVGTSGLYYSSDSGKSWKQFSTDKTLYTIRFINKTTAFAAGKDKIIRIEFK